MKKNDKEKPKDKPKEKEARWVDGREVECPTCIAKGVDAAEVTFASVQELETHRAAAHRPGR